MSTQTQANQANHICNRDDCLVGADRWKVKTTDAQHDALGIVADALSRYLQSGDWHKHEQSPYTGHGSYVVLCHVQMAVLFPDVEIYKGQRQ